ncbi:hypothetical protein QE152_g19145 [Popillia japonica]|uniref:Uncharacterized protein n=1 Tax=Popillia japonica TaxID=7064 RepID=A0AAW1L4F7_POPJA
MIRKVSKKLGDSDDAEYIPEDQNISESDNEMQCEQEGHNHSDDTEDKNNVKRKKNTELLVWKNLHEMFELQNIS